jgi:hypothetical protein
MTKKVLPKKTNKKRKIDIEMEKTNSLFGGLFVAVAKKRIRMWKVVFIFAFIVGITAAMFGAVYLKIQTQSRAEEKSKLMEIIKTKGCVADGLLSGFGGDTDNLIAMINRSECQYLHRAVETWAAPPDFATIEKNIQKIKKPDMIIGMFLAEAINPEAKYYDPASKKEYDFSGFCRKNSSESWGKNVCKANMDNPQYRRYLISIIKRAIDLNITSFLFGQVYMQEGSDLDNSRISEVINASRDYAQKKNKKIIFGAQTNTITNEKYLKNFDYIEGGIGESPNGNLDNGACSDYYAEKKGGWCWALLWDKRYANRANDVVLHLDWNGSEDDDMSVFSKMSRENRIANLDKFYKTFTAGGFGFLMPFLAVINPKNPACYGPSREFYAPDNRYSCKDEDAINAILRGDYKGENPTGATKNIPPETTNPTNTGTSFPVDLGVSAPAY